MQTIAADKKIHAWEAAGLGQAPFRVVGLISLPSADTACDNPMVYQTLLAEASAAMHAHGVVCGSCDVCGTPLVNNFVVKSADSHKFVVGCDCVRKSGDLGMISEVKHIEKKRNSEKKEAARQAEWERGAPAREAAWAEHKRVEAEKQAAADAEAAIVAEGNAWLITVLKSTRYERGGFVDDMIATLGRTPLADLSWLCQSILGDIYAKAIGGRGGSKAYKAAFVEFESHLPAEEEVS